MCAATWVGRQGPVRLQESGERPEPVRRKRAEAVEQHSVPEEPKERSAAERWNLDSEGGQRPEPVAWSGESSWVLAVPLEPESPPLEAPSEPKVLRGPSAAECSALEELQLPEVGPRDAERKVPEERRPPQDVAVAVLRQRLRSPPVSLSM